MNVISKPVAASQNDPASPTAMPAAANDSPSQTFEDLLSRTRRDFSGDAIDAEAQQPRSDDGQTVVKDVQPADPVCLLTVQVRQILSANLPTAAPVTPGTRAPDDGKPASAAPGLAESKGSFGRNRSRTTGNRTDATNSSPPDTQQLLQTQAQQVAIVPLPTEAPATPAAGTSDFEKSGHIDSNAILGFAGDAGGGDFAEAAASTLAASTARDVPSPSLKIPTPVTSEGEDGFDGEQTRAVVSERQITNSPPQNPLRIPETNARQITVAVLPSIAPVNAVSRGGRSNSEAPGIGDANWVTASAGEDGGSSITSAGTLETSFVTGPRTSVDSATALPVTPITSLAAQQAILASPDAKSSAKISIETEAAAQENPLTQTISPLKLNIFSAAGADGTPVAKERHNMAEPVTDQLLKPSANAVGASAADDVKMSSVQEKDSRARRTDPEPFKSNAPIASSSGATDIRSQSAMPISLPDRISSAPTPEFHAATQCVEHTMALAERVSLKGGDHVEVQMRLLDGKEVSVSLHLANGEWKPVFKTDSAALCRALEQSWQKNSAQPLDRSVRFGTPVFESAQSNGGPGANSGGQADAQGRNFARPEQADISPVPPVCNRPEAAVKAAQLSDTGKIRLYA